MPKQNGRQIPDDSSKWIILNKNVQMSIQISLKFFFKFQLKYSGIRSDNGLAPTRRQAIVWTNDGLFTDKYLCHSTSAS